MMKKYFDLKLLILSILSAILHAIAVTSFSIPASLYPAGFSGLSRIISDLLNDFAGIYISYSFIYFFFNAICIGFVFKKIGAKFTIYSIIQFTLVSILTLFFKPLLVLDDRLLYCLFGGILNGLAVGIALSFNFSTGGFDFINVYLSNKYKKSFTNYAFYVNSLILIVAGLIYGWDRAMYSIIFQFCSTQIIKKLHNRYTHTTLTIITKKPDEVSSEILKNIRHGITEIKAEGFYSKQDTTMLYTVVNSYQYKSIIKIVLDVDPHAFINVQNSSEIYGNYYQKPLD